MSGFLGIDSLVGIGPCSDQVPQQVFVARLNRQTEWRLVVKLLRVDDVGVHPRVEENLHDRVCIQSNGIGEVRPYPEVGSDPCVRIGTGIDENLHHP